MEVDVDKPKKWTCEDAAPRGEDFARAVFGTYWFVVTEQDGARTLELAAKVPSEEGYQGYTFVYLNFAEA